MPTLPTLPPEVAPWLTAALSLLLAAGGLATLLRTRGTTLAAPALWWIAAAAAIAAVEAALATDRLDAATLSASLWRYTAAVGTLCPLTAILGAKRPQDRGWQWVVASLWLVLLVPVAQAIVAPGGTRLELFAAWRWLLLGFIAMSLLNYLPTRFALSSLLIAAGQYLLLEGAAGLTPIKTVPIDAVAGVAPSHATLWGVACLAAAWLAAEVAHITRRPAAAQLPQTHRWLNFRDAWGVFWAIRILQRVNHTAELGAWRIRLQWSGLAAAEGAAPPTTLAPELEVALDQTLDSLLRRFERLE